MKCVTAAFGIAVMSLPCALQAATCDEACLKVALDQYVSALTRHNADDAPIGAGARFTENGAVKEIGEGLWSTTTAVGGYQFKVADETNQQALFIGIIQEGATPSIASIRLGIAEGKISQIEHVVARKGSHALFAPEAFTKPHASLSTPIPKAKRLSRDRLVAIADSYFEGIEKHDSKIVLASDSCQRIENGVQTTNQAGRGSRNCAHSADLLTYIKSVDDRRYPIVDEEHGIVVSTILFDIPGEAPTASAPRSVTDPAAAARVREPRTLLLTEWFKIEDGKIQHIEAVMHNLPHGSESGWEQ